MESSVNGSAKMLSTTQQTRSKTILKYVVINAAAIIYFVFALLEYFKSHGRQFFPHFSIFNIKKPQARIAKRNALGYVHPLGCFCFFTLQFMLVCSISSSSNHSLGEVLTLG